MRPTGKVQFELCEECGESLIIVDGECVCKECGLVCEEKSEEHSSYAYVGPIKCSTTHQKACGAPGERLHIVDGVGSYIDYPNAFYFHDIGGAPLPPRAQQFYSRLKRVYDKRARFSGHEADYRALCSLNRVAEILHLTINIRDRAAYLYKKSMSIQLKERYFTSPAIMAYCVLVATREDDKAYPVTIQEVADAFRRIGHNVSPQKIVKVGLCYKAILGVKLKIRRSEGFIDRILQKVISSKIINELLNNSEVNVNRFEREIYATSIKLLKKIDNSSRGGRSPYVLAASTIYAAEKLLAENDRRKPVLTQKLLAEVTGIAEYSIREHYCLILKKIVDAT